MKGFDDKILSLMFYPLKFMEKDMSKYKEIDKKIICNKNSGKVLFILPQWMGRAMFYKVLLSKLKKNYTLVIYRLPNRLLSDNPVEVVEYFNLAKKDIIKTTDYLEKLGYKSFSIFGTSLSVPLALLVANSDKRFKKIILSLPGSDFAECFWESNQLLVKTIKNKMQSKNIDLTMLKKRWRKLSPINNINNINGRKLLIFLAENDKVVPYRYGTCFLDSLKREKVNFEYYIDAIFGHYISGLKELIFPNKIINFLEK